MKTLIVGEAWGKDEALAKRPFVGPSGRLLHKMLREVGIRNYELTNVFNFQPPGNDIAYLCCDSKGRFIPSKPPITKGKYIRYQYLTELERLNSEIASYQPDVIIALGNTALWALTNQTGIGTRRGHWNGYPSRVEMQIPVMPTYHPASILRVYSQYSIVLMDFIKAKQLTLPPERTCLIPETIADLAAIKFDSDVVVCDIETKPDAQQITEVGFASSTSWGVTIPFWTDKGNYWSTLEEELEAWDFVRRTCRDYKIVGQNFSYDITYLWYLMGIPIPQFHGDTLLQHHALQLELPKNLNFLASLYANTYYWKDMSKEDAKELD